MANGGRVLTEKEAGLSLIEEARMKNQRTVQDRVSKRDLLLLAALIIFLAEVIWKEVKGDEDSRPVLAENSPLDFNSIPYEKILYSVEVTATQ